MTREQAQIYAKLSREDVEKINGGYAKHYDILVAYANGAEVEYRCSETDKWIEVIPSFKIDFAEYRVKQIETQLSEHLKPKIGEKLFYVSAFGEVKQLVFDNSIASNLIVGFGNCFRTSEEAKSALERVHDAIKNKTLSKTEKVESLDGHELSDAEKGVIRILRRCKVETNWNCPFVYLERQDKLSTCDAGVLFKFESGTKAIEFGDLADDVIAEAEERREKGEPLW